MGVKFITEMRGKQWFMNCQAMMELKIWKISIKNCSLETRRIKRVEGGLKRALNFEKCLNIGGDGKMAAAIL